MMLMITNKRMVKLYKELLKACLKNLRLCLIAFNFIYILLLIKSTLFDEILEAVKDI